MSEILSMDILKYKPLCLEMPTVIIQYHQLTPIITDNSTFDLVVNRQKHPVLRKMQIGNISVTLIAILNKLSNENVNVIANELLGVIGTNECLNELTDVILKKVTCEKQFIHVYVALIGRISNTPQIMTQLAKKCSVLFEAYMDQKPVEILLSDDAIDKMKLINFMTFISESYVLGLFTYNSINYCITKLILRNYAIHKHFNGFDIEMIITLIEIASPKLKRDNAPVYTGYIKQLTEIAANCTSFRHKCLLDKLISQKS